MSHPAKLLVITDQRTLRWADVVVDGALVEDHTHKRAYTMVGEAMQSLVETKEDSDGVRILIPAPPEEQIIGIATEGPLHLVTEEDKTFEEVNAVTESTLLARHLKDISNSDDDDEEGTGRISKAFGANLSINMLTVVFAASVGLTLFVAFGMLTQSGALAFLEPLVGDFVSSVSGGESDELTAGIGE